MQYQRCPMLDVGLVNHQARYHLEYVFIIHFKYEFAFFTLLKGSKSEKGHCEMRICNVSAKANNMHTRSGKVPNKQKCINPLIITS